MRKLSCYASSVYVRQPSRVNDSIPLAENIAPATKVSDTVT
jgi:hypothetical protein